MHILVLDAIHGGKAISKAFADQGHAVDLVDVYRKKSTIDVKTALAGSYDLIVAPVHLDPDHPLLHFSHAPVISHHEAVRQLLGKDIPHPMIEITGARGKTTTAYALASLLYGAGILHTSCGTYQYPDKVWRGKSSITPASVLDAAMMGNEIHGWLIVEESLGVTGAGTLAIITSDENYFFASGKKSAIEAKRASAQNCKRLLLAENFRVNNRDGIVHIEDAAQVNGTECRITLAGKTCRFTNPLLALPAYRVPLMLAATAALMLGIDPVPLSSFTALTGRMSVSYVNDLLIVDNANSGTNPATTADAAQYARSTSGKDAVTLVIGTIEGDGAVCEGFSMDQIAAAIDLVRPARIIWVGSFPVPGSEEYERFGQRVLAHVATLEEGYLAALHKTDQGSIVLAVKTWR